jgi:hypothetical protein
MLEVVGDRCGERLEGVGSRIVVAVLVREGIEGDAGLRL